MNKSVYKLFKENGIQIPEYIRNMWRTELSTGESDPTLQDFVKSSISKQRICLQQVGVVDVGFNEKTTDQWKKISVEKMKITRVSSQKKVEYFFSMCLAYPTTVKFRSPSSEVKKSPSKKTTVSWPINESARLLHLFQDPSLIMNPKSGLYP